MQKSKLFVGFAALALILAGCSGDEEKPASSTSGNPTTSVSVPAGSSSTSDIPVVNYTITWVVDGNETISQVQAGQTPVYTGTPEKASTAQYSYSFNGWEPTIVEATEDATYTAQFEPHLRSYSVKFFDDDGVTPLDEQTVNYGDTPIAPADPSKSSTAQYSYAFNGWDHAIEEVHGEQTYIATYTPTLRKYTVTWIGADGVTPLETDENVNYGSAVSFDGSTPTKDGTAEKVYNFDGWTTDGVVVKEEAELPTVGGNVTYYAHFSEAKRKYTVKFVNWNDDELDSISNVDYDADVRSQYDGDEPTCNQNPTLIYEFDEWVEQDRDEDNFIRYYKATFSKVVTKAETLSFSLESDHYICNGFSSSSNAEVIVPSSYNDLPVTKIKNNSSFYGVEKITIPASVTEIGNSAFNGHNPLHEVIIKGNPNIGNSAFYNANNLTKFSMEGTGAYTIGNSAFTNTKCNEVFELGTGVTEISNYAFSGCKMTTFPILNDLTFIDYRAFQGCTEIESIEFGSKLKTIGYAAFINCTKLESVILPNSLVNRDTSVEPNRDLGNNVFEGCSSLKYVKLGSGLTSIPSDWFTGTAIEEFEVDEKSTTFTAIDGVLYKIKPEDKLALAMYPCGKAGDYTTPDNVIEILGGAFQNAKALGTVTITGEVDTIPSYCFNFADVKTVVLSDLVETIQSRAFKDSKVETITFGSGLTTIEQLAFAGAKKLTSLNFDSATDFVMSSGVVYNKAQTVLYCALASKEGTFEVPDGVLTIMGGAFSNSNLSKVIVCDSVASMGQQTFESAAVEEVELGSGVTTIPGWCFNSCQNLTKVTFDDNVTTILQGAFEYTAIASFTASSKLTSIGSEAFYHCDSLTTVDLGGVKNIAGYCFYYSGLTAIELPSSLTALGSGFVNNCHNLVTLDMSGVTSVTEFPTYAAQYCNKLTDVTLGSELTKIGEYAFNNCAALEEIEIPSKVTRVDQHAFSNCGKLGTISLPKNLETIGYYAFGNIKADTTITYAGSSEDWAGNKSTRNTYWGSAAAVYCVSDDTTIAKTDPDF